MRQLRDNSNAYMFIPKLHDLILPSKQEVKKCYPMGGVESNYKYIFIIMDYSRSDLRQLIELGDKTNFTHMHIKVIMYYLLCSVNFIHSAGIIHRDIKPSNILINTESQVQLCDFGISRSLPFSITESGSGNSKRFRDSIYKLTKEDKSLGREEIKYMIWKKIEKKKDQIASKKRCLSTHVGSRWYRAPEIILLEKHYDSANDLWSLGCCIYELMFFLKN